MTLIKSISGFRGTIGEQPGDNLTPIDLVKFASAFSQWMKEQPGDDHLKIILGRDARISGELVGSIVSASVNAMGIDVVDLGFATTPTVEVAVVEEGADGGIILTASHNPGQWNALKLLNNKGEFLTAEDGKRVLELADNELFQYVPVDDLGQKHMLEYYEEVHIRKILELPLVDIEAIKRAKFKVVIDCVNSVGGIAIPKLLNALGVMDVVELYCEPTGLFPHNPEPLPEHLKDLSEAVVTESAHLGFVVDPDVDRLAIICEDGSMFGEEYTLVAVADYILKNKVGNTVSNLSSSRALRDVTQTYGGQYSPSAVGEVNVVAMMKESNAVIGGEGNGGVIYPDLHYGRDALVGIALFLTHLAKQNVSCLELRNQYPDYYISKNKIELTADIDIDDLLSKIQTVYTDAEINTIDGVKFDFENGWVHLRKSNTEPIIRVYAESNSSEAADLLAKEIMDAIQKLK
ncbi:MAG: phosphoglucosamine mutase [Marinilabiliales bacterium]|nr:MAG: phosphoglucosamine mutase [Marinilabiliales bacterium]